ncbi:MAG: DUF2155 domain-containing protein [Alphaproteobacteria bacterium]
MIKAFILFFSIFFAFFSSAEESVFDILPEEQSDDFIVSEPDEEITDPAILKQDIFSNTLSDSENSGNNEVTEKDYYNTAIIKILDKNIANFTLIPIKINTNTIFNNITIRPRLCFQTSNDGQIESKLLVEVRNNNANSNNKIFSSWIFANNPAISMFEHPQYNINLVKCENIKN